MFAHKKFLFISIFLITLNCSSSKVTKNHGIIKLDKKNQKVIVNKTNKNDLIDLLGPPSTISEFDNNVWFYIESVKVNQSIIKLGKKKLKKNNILIVELNNRGIVEEKEFFNKTNMNELKYSKDITQKGFSETGYIYTVLTSLRQKINAPSKNRKRKN